MTILNNIFHNKASFIQSIEATETTEMFCMTLFILMLQLVVVYTKGRNIINANIITGLYRSNVVLDVSTIHDSTSFGSGAIKKFLLNHHHAGVNNRVVFYYETDFDGDILAKINNVSNWVSQLDYDHFGDNQNAPEIMFSLRYSSNEWIYAPEVISRYPTALSISDSLKKLVTFPFLRKLAFEFIDSSYNNSCRNMFDRGGRPIGPKIVQDLKSFLEKCLNCSEKLLVGHTTNHDLIQCRDYQSALTEADFVVTKIQFELYNNFVESFGAFKRYIDSVDKKTKTFLAGIKSGEILVFYHLSYTNLTTDVFQISEEDIAKVTYVDVNEIVESERRRNIIVNNKNRCLFEQFVMEWSSANAAFIVLNDYSGYCLRERVVESFMIPDVTDLFDRFDRPCNFNRFMSYKFNNFWEQNFHSVMFTLEAWEDLQLKSSKVGDIQCNTILGSEFLNQTLIFNKINSSIASKLNYSMLLHHENDSNSNIDSIHGLLNIFDEHGSRSIYVNLDLNDIVYNTNVYNNDRETISKRIRFACYKRIYGMQAFLPGYEYESEYIYISLRRTLESVEEILELLNSQPLCEDIILVVDLKLHSGQILPEPNSIYSNHLLNSFKKRVSIIEDIVRKEWPGKRIILSLDGIYLDIIRPSVTRGETLYCNPIAASIMEYFEAIFTWAEIYEIPLLLSNFPKTRYTSPTSWIQYKSDASIPSAVLNDFSLGVQRSYNHSNMFGKWTNGIKPCLDWQSHLEAPGIDFTGSLTGTYFQVETKYGVEYQVTENDLQVMLIFAFARFKLTEIKVARHADLQTLQAVLTNPDLQKVLSDNSLSGRYLFLNIPLRDIVSNSIPLSHLERDLIRTISNVSDDILLNIHFLFPKTYWQGSVLTFSDGILGTFTTNKRIKVGLEVEDCAEIIEHLANAHAHNGSSSNLAFYKIFNMLTYIVCTIPGRGTVGENKLEMQKFLETHIYIKTLLRMFFPNIQEVYFKLLADKTVSSNEKDLLLLLNQLNDFAKGYNISYFLLPSFSKENSTENSWWKILNYSALFDPESYHDIESKYLKQEPWRPVLVHKEDPSKKAKELTPSSTFWIYTGLATVIVVLLTILVLVIIRARQNAKLLSEEEIQEFLKGRENARENDFNDNDYNSEFVKGGYDNNYEIDKSDISIERNNVLGIGNFGAVYKATMNSGLRSVAVKMPHENCDKQAFIGMLREVKLLVYIGNHQNVVEFIGSYTKEIQDKVIYVVMEFCTGGSLLSHLRNMKLNNENRVKHVNFEDLVRFCRDIASGMEYIASKGVVHGDLSARNILLDNLAVCKISDFGLSRKLYEYRTYIKKTQEPLPWRWMAYETLVEMEFSEMADVWSFGVTAWETFSLGDVPYSGVGWTTSFVNELEEGMRLLQPKFATNEIFQKLLSCWKLEVEERPCFAELHNFFTGHLPYDVIE